MEETVYRSSITGKYVSAEFAEANPDTTYGSVPETAANESRILATPLGERGPAPIEWCIPITEQEREALVTAARLVNLVLNGA